VFKTFTGGSTGAAPVGGASGQVSAPGGWHPTILYLGGLIFLEVIVIGFLLRFVK